MIIFILQMMDEMYSEIWPFREDCSLVLQSQALESRPNLVKNVTLPLSSCSLWPSHFSFLN